eukprot:752303-Hanusia_phi.AAC.8
MVDESVDQVKVEDLAGFTVLPYLLQVRKWWISFVEEEEKEEERGGEERRGEERGEERRGERGTMERKGRGMGAQEEGGIGLVSGVIADSLISRGVRVKVVRQVSRMSSLPFLSCSLLLLPPTLGLLLFSPSRSYLPVLVTG